MPQRTLQHVLDNFRQTLGDCRNFAADAYKWSLPGASPRITKKRLEAIAELVFLRGVLAWEIFLEESFVLYLLGRTPPRGRTPKRFTFPPSKELAEEWVIPEGRPYAAWDAVAVSTRAERFFRNGRPFTAALRGSQSVLDEMRIIRNAIAHKSKSARLKFENLVRTRLGTLPPMTSVGRFLEVTIPGSSPPSSFLDYYFNRIALVAEQIVPPR